MKLVGPWKQRVIGHYFRMSIINPDTWKSRIWERCDGTWNALTFCNIRANNFYSLEEAMKYADQQLIDAGYKLLTEDQFNKLLVLK